MSEPAKTLKAAYQQLRFDQPLEEDDLRYVDTVSARDSFSRDSIIRQLEAYGGDGDSSPIRNGYFLYSGHMGCGKSTELRRLAKDVNALDKFSVVFLDVLKHLDPNSLSYPEVLMALASELLRMLVNEGRQVDPIFFSNLETWFTERVEKHESTKELAAELA